MSRLLGGVVVGLLTLSGMNVQAAQPQKKSHPTTFTLPESIEFVRASVVQISVQVTQPATPNGPMQIPTRPISFPIGSGFIVNAGGYVITARHVVQYFQTAQFAGVKRLLIGLALPNLDEFKSGGLTLSMRGSFVETECEVVDEDARHDLALLKMKQNPFKGELGTFMRAGNKIIDYPHKVATFSVARPQDGEAIAVSGYPLSSNVLITTSGTLASSWASDIGEVQVPGAPAGMRMPDTADSYIADMHANSGNSGGPVYSVKQAKVIGVCVSFNMAPVIYGDGMKEPASVGNRPLAYNSGLSVVVPIRYVTDLLKKHNLT